MDKFLKVLKNYYIVFSVCLLCVLVAGIMFGVKYYNEYKARKIALAPPPEVEFYAPPVSKNETTIKKDEKKETIVKTVEKKKNEETTEVMAPKLSNDFKIIMPVTGDVLKEFSKDNLVYSKTFEDYRTHNGIDIKTKRSEAVFSVSDGVVEDIYTDSLEGIVIVINHNNGFKSIYKNLSSDKMVKKGESVTEGQVISGVGETAIFESADEEHLHFELKKDDMFVNPLEYVK